MPALKCRRWRIWRTRLRVVLQAAHRAVQRREEGRRHGVHALGVQLGATAPSVIWAKKSSLIVAPGQRPRLAWAEALSSACATAPYTATMGRFLTADGPRAEPARLAAAGARGTVLIVHGLGERKGRYEQVAATLAAQGWQVVAYDQRGHG